MTYRELIFNKIVERVQAASFYRISDDGRTMTSSEETVEPRSVQVGEDGKSFGDSRRNDRLRQSIVAWDWALGLDFNDTVSMEDFENQWMARVPVIDATDDTRVIFLYLEGAEYVHPERKNSPRGTYARYRIRAELGPQ
jgi:hypothetical protein